MAFFGIFLTILTVALIILGISAFIAALCFIVSGIIMLCMRRKNKDGGKVKSPWYVKTLRVVGSIALLPIILSICLIIYALIADAADKRTNLARAVMRKDYSQAETILKNGADPDIKDDYGRTLLMCVASHEVYVSSDGKDRYEYEAGSNLNDSDDDDIKMMTLLLDYGADINAKVTDCGDKSNHEYQEGGWTDVYANSEQQCGNTVLIYAVRYRSAEVVDFLIDKGADVNAANSCGFTPLLMCADMRLDNDGGLEIASRLIEKGADPGAVTNFHQNIIWLLDRRNSDENSEMTELIKKDMQLE